MARSLPGGGVYLLHLHLERPQEISTGALGRLEFAPGVYLYAGSASRGLPHRLRRHFAAEKSLRWHIDYLSAHPAVAVRGAWVWDAGRGLEECALNAIAGGLPGASTPVAGFGASDCQAGCPAHLWHLPGMAMVRLPPGGYWVPSGSPLLAAEGDLD